MNAFRHVMRNERNGGRRLLSRHVVVALHVGYSGCVRPLASDLSDESRPWFFWDEDLSVAELRALLADERHPRWVELAAKVMREARDDQVWRFLPVHRVGARYGELRPRLGRRSTFWDYLLDAWRRHGLL